jgi:competence protein ComGC
MILSGDLKDFSLADVLQLLLQQRKTGVLNLENGKEKAEIFISGGNVNGVRVNGEMPENKITEMLVASGKLDKAELHQLESISRDMNRPLLTTLAAKGHLTDEDKKEWLQIISEDMVCELFGWLTGKYDFGTGLKSHVTFSMELTISTEFACMEGMRRIDEWPRLKEKVPDPKVVFKSIGKAYTGDPLSWDYLVLGLVDGRKNVGQISKQLPFGAFRLSECLVNLWEGGFIVPLAGSADEIGIIAPVDPQTEKDRKTALVLGLALMMLVFAIVGRLLYIWMQEIGKTDMTKDIERGGYESVLANSFSRDNVQALLMDYAARKDRLPEHLNQLVKEGVLVRREVEVPLGNKPFYKKTSEKTYQFK